MLTFWRRLCIREKADFSEAWRRDLARRGDRIEFHGVSIKWPIRKLLNESPLWNRAKERKPRMKQLLRTAVFGVACVGLYVMQPADLRNLIGLFLLVMAGELAEFARGKFN